MSATVELIVAVCNLFNTFVSFNVARVFNHTCPHTYTSCAQYVKYTCIEKEICLISSHA